MGTTCVGVVFLGLVGFVVYQNNITTPTGSRMSMTAIPEVSGVDSTTSFFRMTDVVGAEEDEEEEVGTEEEEEDEDDEEDEEEDGTEEEEDDEEEEDGVVYGGYGGKNGKGSKIFNGGYYGGGFDSLLGGNLGSKAVDGSYGGNRGSDGGVGYGKFGSKGYYGPGSYYSKGGGGSISLVGGNVGAEEEGEEDGVAKLNSKYAKKSAPQFYFVKGGKGSKGGYGGFFSELQGLVALFGGSDYLGDTDDPVGFYGGKGGKGSKGGYYGEVEY